jgi:hypothetical protein
VQSGVTQEPVLDPLLFKFFKKFYANINNPSNCLFADDISVYEAFNPSRDCFLLKSDIV